LRARPMGHMLLALGFPGAAAPAFAVRPAGPQTWIVIGDAPLSPGDLAQRESELGGAVALVDLTTVGSVWKSPGQARRASSPLASRSISLSSAFPVGASCQTLCGHIAVHLTRTGPESFELIVGRSLAHDLWRALSA